MHHSEKMRAIKIYRDVHTFILLPRVSFKNTVTFYLVPGVWPFVLPNVKNREKIAGVDFFKIPVFSKWLLVVIFAFSLTWLTSFG